MSGVCDVLEWDSAFFGRSIARYRGARCAGADLEALTAECRTRGIECVYVLIDPSDTESVVTLCRAGAFFADVRLVFDAPVLLREPDARVRIAIPSDEPRLRQLAAVSHRLTRFQADPGFPADRCDALYETWIANSCAGGADAVLVADEGDGRPVGYVTCHNEPDHRGRIGLFAVADDRQGRGLGGALMAGAIAWFAAQGATTISVVTQLRNARAIRAYERAGLTLSAAGFWFHYWPRAVVPRAPSVSEA